MSIIVTETTGGKKIQRGEDGSRSASRSFIVYDDEGLALTTGDVVNAYGLPYIGQVYPDSGGLYAAGYNLSLHDSRLDTWEIEWTYGTVQLTEDDDEVDPVDDTAAEQDLNVTVKLTVIDIFKSGATLPSNAACINDPSPTGCDYGDVGGTLTDFGYPISFALPTADIKITKTYSGQFNGAGLISVTGARNQSSWLGFPQGSVLFAGVGYTAKGGTSYSLTFSLHFDSWFHLRQVPDRAPDGRPNFDIDAGTMEVYWRQPFNNTTSFSFLPVQ
tara:strand:+ start:841 stop:1659 length:819 start_codon:yes stop_codon:yes gene_type:complete